MASSFSAFFLRFGKDCIADGRRSAGATTLFGVIAVVVAVGGVALIVGVEVGGVSYRREERRLCLLMGAKTSRSTCSWSL